MVDEIRLKPIGVVQRLANDDQVRNRLKNLESRIEIFEEYRDALEGLDGFSHVFVVGYFNRLRPEQIGPLRVKPKGLLREGFTLDELPTVGVFALDSPTRPNPIGLSLARLIKVETSAIVVEDLDFFNDTPVLDVKPYQTGYIAKDYALPQWHLRLLARAGHV